MSPSFEPVTASATLIDSDLVVSGGGSQGLAEAATICALSSRIRFRRVGGASVGSVIAAGLALGFVPEHMVEVFTKLLTRGQPGNYEESLEDWKYPGPFKPLGMLNGRGGMMRGNVLREALTDVFGKTRMGDVQIPFRVKVGCMSRRKTETVYSNVEEHKRFFIVDVCMCSSAVPGLIDNQQLDPHNFTGPDASHELYCDGGTGNNVPRAMWDDSDDEPLRPTTIVRFVDGDEPIPARTPFEKLVAYWNIARDAAEAEVSKKPPTFVWDVPIAVDGNPLALSLTAEECAHRIAVGNAAAESWLAKKLVETKLIETKLAETKVCA